MRREIVAVMLAALVVLAGGVGLVYGQSVGQPALGRPGEDQSSDASALALALADKKLEFSGLFGTDLRLTVGVDVWGNQWQTGFGVNPNTQGFKNLTATALGVGIIPNVTLSYGRFFTSASYMWTPDYDFGRFSDVINGVGGAFVLEQSTRASRQEAEAVFGYRFFETDRGGIGVAVGYKGIFQDYVTSTRCAALATPQAFVPGFCVPDGKAGGHSKTNYNGPIAGLVGNASLGSGFSLFGNAAGGVLYTNCDPSCPTFGSAPYAAAKVGASYRPFEIPLAFTLGYRVQVLNTEQQGVSPRTGNAIDLTHGLIFGANWSF